MAALTEQINNTVRWCQLATPSTEYHFQRQDSTCHSGTFDFHLGQLLASHPVLSVDGIAIHGEACITQ